MIDLIQQNELITLLVGFGGVLYIVFNKTRLTRIPGFQILFSSYMILCAGWIFTVVEGFFLGSFVNALEHLCYAVSSILAAVWCHTVCGRGYGVR